VTPQFPPTTTTTFGKEKGEAQKRPGGPLGLGSEKEGAGQEAKDRNIERKY
jgi:hypothetical protein